MEIATIFRENIYEYSKKYSNLYIPANFNAVNSIIKCRTSELGGEVYYCPNCEKEHYVYHSCKNRHCPKCGSEDSYKWLENNWKSYCRLIIFWLHLHSRRNCDLYAPIIKNCFITPCFQLLPKH